MNHNTIFQNIFNIITRIIAIIGIVITAFLALFSSLYTTLMQTNSESTGIIKDSLIANIFLFLLFIVIMGFFAKIATKLSTRVIHIGAILLSLLVVCISLQFVYSANSYFVSDQLFINLSAIDMYENKFSLGDFGFYFRTYPFQLCLVHFYAFIFRLFGDTAPAALQSVQAICLGLSYYIGFRITSALFKDSRADCFYLIGTLPFIPMYLYTLFLYGETFGILGSMLSIYLFICANNSWNSARIRSIVCYIVLLICLVFAALARSALVIVGIALLIVQFILFIKNRQIIPLVLVTFVFCLTLFGRAFFIGLAEKNAGLEIGGGTPASSWIVMGLQESDMGPGYYNGYNIVTFTDNNFNKELTSELASQELSHIIENWLKRPVEFLLFLKDKGVYQWCEPSYSSFTITRFMEEPQEWIYQFYWEAPNYITRQFLNYYQSIFYILTLGAFLAILKKRESPLMLLPGLVFIGGFLFTLIWEGKSRYAYPYVVIVMPYLAKGILFYLEQLPLCVKMIICGLTTKDKKKTSEVTQ